MAYKDIREYLAALEVRGKLHHVKKEVDPNWEVAAVIRRVRMAPKGCATTDNGPHVSCASSGWLGWR